MALAVKGSRGAAQGVCSGVGSRYKDLIHRTAHCPAGRGWTQRLAGCRLPELCAGPNTTTTEPCKPTSLHIPLMHVSTVCLALLQMGLHDFVTVLFANKNLCIPKQM